MRKAKTASSPNTNSDGKLRSTVHVMENRHLRMKIGIAQVHESNSIVAANQGENTVDVGPYTCINT